MIFSSFQQLIDFMEFSNKNRINVHTGTYVGYKSLSFVFLHWKNLTVFFTIYHLSCSFFFLLNVATIQYMNEISFFFSFDIHLGIKIKYWKLFYSIFQCKYLNYKLMKIDINIWNYFPQSSPQALSHPFSFSLPLCCGVSDEMHSTLPHRTPS